MFSRFVVRFGRATRHPAWRSAQSRASSSASRPHRPIETWGVAVGTIGLTAFSLSWVWPSKPSLAEGFENDIDVRSTLPVGSFLPPQHDNSPENLTAARQEFIALLGEKGVDDSPGELKSRSSTEWSPSPTDKTAALIVFPETTEHVSAIMKVCHRRNIPVTPYSGGTSLDGALAATRGGICIDFRRMNRILAVHKDDLDVVVQPAVGWQELNVALSPDDLFFPVDPGPGAQIGGMIATGCSGTNAYRYGPMKDWVISATVVLADGTIVKTRRRPRKCTAGYDLTRLLISSSGTLGLVTEATLKITALPQNQHVALAAFPSAVQAVSAVIEMLQTGLQAEALELLDSLGMHAANESGYTAKTYKEIPTLFMKFAGPTQAAVENQIRAVQSLVQKHGSESFEASSDAEEMDAIWSARKTFLWSFLALKKNPEDKFLSADLAVPISQMAKIIGECEDKFKTDGLIGNTMGHVGDGNFHLSVLYNEQEKEKAENMILWARRRAIELDGTVTGEHGVGLALRDVLTEEVGPTGTDMMRRIKMALDPKCLLACDKVVRIDSDPEH